MRHFPRSGGECQCSSNPDNRRETRMTSKKKKSKQSPPGDLFETRKLTRNLYKNIQDSKLIYSNWIR